MLARGIPDAIRPDNENIFRTGAARRAIEALGTDARYAAPHRLNDKAPLERFVLTIKKALFRRLPGYKGVHTRCQKAARKHVDDLLELPELRARIAAWISNAYHGRPKVYLELGGVRRSPEDVWRDFVRFRAAPDACVLDVLLLKDDTARTAHGEGIKLTCDGRHRLCNAPDLARHIGERVWLRYNPYDMESVLVYRTSDNLRIGEAFDQVSAATSFKSPAVACHR